MNKFFFITLLLIACKSVTSVPNPNHMKLWVLHDYGEREETITKTASLKDIENLMQKLNWNQFHQVILEKSNGDLMEVGGSFEDGLAVVYQENDETYVITNPPTTVEEMTYFLRLYFDGNTEYRTKHKFE